MQHPLGLRAAIEGVIGGVAFVVAPLQTEVATVALPSKALLGTLHLRHHRRHRPLPLVAMACHQTKKGIEGPILQMLRQVPWQIPKLPMLLKMLLRHLRTTYHLLPLIT